MKKFHVIGATAAIAGVAGPAFAATSTAPRTVATMRAKVDAKADHITAKLQTPQTRVAADSRLAAARSTLQADITTRAASPTPSATPAAPGAPGNR